MTKFKNSREIIGIDAISVTTPTDHTGHWLDDIIETLRSIANENKFKLEEKPELLADFLPQQARLVRVTHNLIAIRGDLLRAQANVPHIGFE